MSAHQISRGKAKTCKELVAELKTWDKRIELVTEVMEKLKDPQFVLERLVLLLQPIIGELMSSGHDVGQAESALQELRSFLMQANEIHNSNSNSNPNPNPNPNPNQLTQIEAWALRTKEESHSITEELNQIIAFLESSQNVSVYLLVAHMLEKVVRSCSNMAALGILSQDVHNQVQGYHGDGTVTYSRNVGQLTLIFPPPPVHEQEVIKEMTLTIRSVAGRLAELKLANPEFIRTTEAESMLPNPEMVRTTEAESKPPSPGILDNLPQEDFDFLADILGDTCIIQNYKVSKCNADALQEIFNKHPTVDENFRISHPDFKNCFMNSLAGLYKKIKSGEEDKLKLEDITNMESKVRDMELTGLHLPWLRKMLTDVREEKNLTELLTSKRGEAQKAEQEAQEVEKLLAKLKKRRFD
ncbi:hypothetical protein V6N13_109882 [Hibiscus sabdariffa]|uniref:Uncharacterized protein n=1 Tax=Hibiscus sabdariffa TaxID=183260 RepID=A0ABR2FQZ4_9ROSI